MKRISVHLAMGLLLVTVAGAQPAAKVADGLETSFLEARSAYLERVVGHTIDTADARAFMSAHGIDPGRVIPQRVVITGTANPHHIIDEEGNTLPDAHTATLRFRADLVNASGQENQTWGEQSHAEMYCTVLFVHRDDRWVKVGSTVLYEIERYLPPNDMRYGMRPFTAQISRRLNDLPPFP
ncbi:hypothetical protein JXA47_07680 [Candidatus Sumerlaeota bacterium]|nr:hypothetical protein [Candidatus Sumerlaeota bacterium]